MYKNMCVEKWGKNKTRENPWTAIIITVVMKETTNRLSEYQNKQKERKK